MYVTSPIAMFETANPMLPHWSGETTLENSHISNIGAGQPLFCEGDDAKFVYEILEGTVRTSKMLCDGRRQVVSFGYPGDMIGLSHDSSYHSDCEAISDVKVRILRKNAFSASSQIDPELCDRFLKHAAAEVNAMQEHFMMLGRKSAVEKVSSFLIVLLDRVSKKQECTSCFNLPMSRSDIADFLGLTIETVSRSLTKLRKDGIIDLPTPHKVCVRRSEALRGLAENDE